MTLHIREIQHIGEAIKGAYTGTGQMAAPVDIARYIVGALSPILASHNGAFDAAAFREAAGVTDCHTQEQLERIGAMAGFCDVTFPDSTNGPAAKWLHYLEDSIAAAWQNEEFDPASSDRDHEIIDAIASNSVPVEQHLCWVIFSDLEAYMLYDPSEEHPAMGEDASRWCADMLEEIACTGLHAWLEEAKRGAQCAECEEYPCKCPEDDDSDG